MMRVLPQAKPFIVPVFIPHRGCPHRCVFCNQRAITGVNQNFDAEAIKSDIETYLGYKGPGRGVTQISFYGGTFLGQEPHRIRECLTLAQDFISRSRVDSLRFSTRPDTISQTSLDLIEPYAVDTVELGVQSMDNTVLEMSGRGHKAEDTLRAVDLLNKCEYNVGLQMMVGLCGDTTHSAMETARAMVALKPDFVRIYPTLVLSGSPLARLYHQGKYSPMTLEQSISLVKRLYLLFNTHGISVIRMGLQASEGLDEKKHLLAGPYHPSFGHLVYQSLFLDLSRQLLDEKSPEETAHPVFFVHPSRISIFRGLKNANIHILGTEYDCVDIKVKGDEALAHDAIKLSDTVTTLAAQGDKEVWSGYC